MIFKRNIALVLLCVTHSCVTQETIDPIQLYFEDVQEQLEVGSFKEGFRRGLHLYGTDTQAKTAIINDLANQSKCTLITINIAELIEGNTSQSLQSLFQQAQKTAGGVILCIDELQILTKSKKYRNYLDELWAECATCFEWYPHIFIVITCTDCRYIDRAFKKQFTCISYPTVPALTMPSKEPPVIQEPVVPPVVQTVPQESPLEKKEAPSVTLPRRQPVTIHQSITGWNIVKGIATAGVITGLLCFKQEEHKIPESFQNQLMPTPKDHKKTTLPLPEEPIKKSLIQKLHPYLPQILTTVGLLIDELSQSNIAIQSNSHSTCRRLSEFFCHHILRKELYTTMEKEGIQVRVLPGSPHPPFNKDQYFYIGEAWNDRIIGKAWETHSKKIKEEEEGKEGKEAKGKLVECLKKQVECVECAEELIEYLKKQGESSKINPISLQAQLAAKAAADQLNQIEDLENKQWLEEELIEYLKKQVEYYKTNQINLQAQLAAAVAQQAAAQQAAAQQAVAQQAAAQQAAAQQAAADQLNQIEDLENKQWLEKDLLNFITAKHVAHITDNNEERILVTDIAIILGVPCLLHVYNIVAQKVFNAALSTLETHKTSQKIVQTIQSVHNSIVKNPLTQIFITYALRASYKRYIEIKAHEKALINTFGISLDKIKEINTFLEDLANKRKTEKKSLIGQLRTSIESLPFCSPHVDTIPLPLCLKHKS